MSTDAGISLILASASPRRLQLLQQFGHDPLCVPVDVDVQRLARRKAECCLQHHAHLHGVPDSGDLLVLGADTVIDLDGEVLGKPRDREQALEMLQRLSEREHAVVSGVCLLRATGPGLDNLQSCDSLCVRTVLRFGPVSAEQAAAYWETGEPVDKAGAYAIQGRGAQFVAHLSGSYSNVVGLPLYETQSLLQQAGLAVGRAK